MELRWLITRNNVTAKTIKEYQEIHGCGLMAAKNALVNETKELQYFNTNVEQWTTIPTVVTTVEPDMEKRPDGF